MAEEKKNKPSSAVRRSHRHPPFYGRRVRYPDERMGTGIQRLEALPPAVRVAGKRLELFREESARRPAAGPLRKCPQPAGACAMSYTSAERCPACHTPTVPLGGR